MIFHRWDKSARGFADCLGGCLGFAIGMIVLGILILVVLS